ncbi:MAG: helix-turn-helix domain-containing protein [Reyranella sp.]|uniref:helix-turn-helix domain-containing protein n=1 Tax=Reyranella sp. TaxID=1929291 RepID=UPI0025DAB848|nr:helix-turn-helix domain-containing protein [Reyranella sp.]MBR2813438.1 helix-turn-helix domain-containing protein [Reyranella sp.]
MTPRLVDQIEEAEASITVDRAAIMLGCDPSTVRKLLRRQQLTGHRVGLGDQPNGVRVHLESVRAYKRRHAIGGDPELPKPPQPPRPPKRAEGADYREALAYLKAAGVRF